MYSLVSKWASNSCQCFAGTITSCEQYVLSLQSCQHLSTTLCLPVSVNGMIFTACEHMCIGYYTRDRYFPPFFYYEFLDKNNSVMNNTFNTQR